MTRVIAGTAGGRELRTPSGRGTRPTSDRVREALFSSLEARDAVSGARVMDLYAGSGALGLEAASRGAAEVTLVESDRAAASVIRDNVARLRLHATVLSVTVASALEGSARAQDLVLLDPPYDLSEDALAADLSALVSRGWLDADALVVVERSKRSPEPAWPDALEPERVKTYGETVIWYAIHRTPTRHQTPLISEDGLMSDYEIPRPTSGDVLDLILSDHRLFEDLIRECRRNDSDRAGARSALAELIVAHGEAEEEKVYPALRRKRAITGHEQEHGEEEHAEINEALVAFLEAKGTDTDKYDSALEELATVLNHHANEEEQTILNPAREEVSEQARATLGVEWLSRRNELLEQGCASLEQVQAILHRAEEEGVIASPEAREKADAIKDAAKEEAKKVEEASKEAAKD